MRGFRHWRWHLDEMYVKLNGEMVYLWRTAGQESEILESFATRKRDKEAALSFMKRALKRHGSPEAITTDGLASYKAAMKVLGNTAKQEVGRWANNQVENSHLRLPTTRAGDALILTDEDAAEVRVGPRQRPQPFRSGTPPRRSPDLQGAPLGRTGRAAKPHGLGPRVQRLGRAGER